MAAIVERVTTAVSAKRASRQAGPVGQCELPEDHCDDLPVLGIQVAQVKLLQHANAGGAGVTGSSKGEHPAAQGASLT